MSFLERICRPLHPPGSYYLQQYLESSKWCENKLPIIISCYVLKVHSRNSRYKEDRWLEVLLLLFFSIWGLPRTDFKERQWSILDRRFSCDSRLDSLRVSALWSFGKALLQDSSRKSNFVCSQRCDQNEVFSFCRGCCMENGHYHSTFL